MDSSTLALYHTFAAVAKNGSLSAAARQLYISQPAISKALSRLEKLLDTRLFFRNARGVTLTPEGEALYQYVSRAFDTLNAGEENLNHIKHLGLGHIRIGVSSTLCKHLLLPYLSQYVKENPHVQVVIACQSTQHTLRLLENNELDVGLIAQPRHNAHVRLLPLGLIQDIFAATPEYINHLKIRNGIDDGEILRHASLILLDKENLTRKYVEEYLEQWQISTEHALEVNSMELLIDFTKTGLGVGCIIRRFIEKELASGALVEIAAPAPMKARQVCFACTAKARCTPAVSSFLDLVEAKLPDSRV